MAVSGGGPITAAWMDEAIQQRAGRRRIAGWATATIRGPVRLSVPGIDAEARGSEGKGRQQHKEDEEFHRVSPVVRL
jgi:hypothetical protein